MNKIRRFNHLPGGSNVLYFDGHVEFVKDKTRYPLTEYVSIRALQGGDTGVGGNILDNYKAEIEY